MLTSREIISYLINYYEIEAVFYQNDTTFYINHNEEICYVPKDHDWLIVSGERIYDIDTNDQLDRLMERKGVQKKKMKVEQLSLI